MVTRYSLAIEIGSSNLSSYAKSGGSKFDPWAEHHCGVEKWSSRHPHKVKIGSSNLPSRNQMLPSTNWLGRNPFKVEMSDRSRLGVPSGSLFLWRSYGHGAEHHRINCSCMED